MLRSPVQVHIPDGFLSVPVALVGWLLTLILLAGALRRTNALQGSRTLPLMGLLAAFLFAAQAINFPVMLGTSGHLLGGALAAILLGPWQGMLVMTAVVSVQALVFQDGGLLALGWNLFNMGALGCFVGDLAFRGLHGRPQLDSRWVPARVFLAGWLSVQATAAAASLQLAASGTIALRLVLPAMLGVHALVGIGEGLATAGAVAFLRRTQLTAPVAAGGDRRAAYLLIGFALALLLAPLASPLPDALEQMAERLALEARALVSGPLSDYAIPGVRNAALSTALAVALGSTVLAALGWLAGWALARGER